MCTHVLPEVTRLLTSAEVNALLAVPGNHTCADCAPGRWRSASGKVRRPCGPPSIWVSSSRCKLRAYTCWGCRHPRCQPNHGRVEIIGLRRHAHQGNDVVNAELEASGKIPKRAHRPLVRQTDDKDNNNSNNTAAAAVAAAGGGACSRRTSRLSMYPNLSSSAVTARWIRRRLRRRRRRGWISEEDQIFLLLLHLLLFRTRKRRISRCNHRVHRYVVRQGGKR